MNTKSISKRIIQSNIMKQVQSVALTEGIYI